MNGLVIWIYNIINWFRRVYYHFKGAVSVYGELCPNKQGTWQFVFNYEGVEQTVTVTEPGLEEKIYDYVTDKNEAELLWIPGAKRAMLKRYMNNSAVLACDLVSVICLILLIAGFVIIGTSASSGSPAFGAGIVAEVSIACMIILAFVRKKYRQ